MTIEDFDLSDYGYVPIKRIYDEWWIILAQNEQDYQNKVNRIRRGDRDGFLTIKRAKKRAMTLPINNRIRSEYIVPKEMIERSHIPDGLVEQMNKQLMARIADEIFIAKPDIVEHSTIKFDDKNPYAQDYHRLQAEVFVFTKDELMDLIRRIQVETSTQIREQMTLVDDWKNKL